VPLAPPERGTETVLLVEDEEAVGQLAEAILVRAGYQVLRARAGESALELAEVHPGTIHLLLTDLTLPGMDGERLAAKLTALRPDTRVLLMTGYAGEALVWEIAPERAVNLLQKPWTPVELLRRVREALQG
jgi:response regulator RpfG family c-di-GMP phosphodiesterase